MLALAVMALGGFGALIFNMFLLPLVISVPVFENFQFVKDFKQGRIVVNQKETIYVQENNSIQDAIAKSQKSIVAIQGASGLKSGVVLTTDGLIATLASAIPASGNYYVFLNGSPEAFSVVKTDTKNNLALLKIEKNNLPTVPFADVNKTRLGQKVFLTGSLSEEQITWFAIEGIIREIGADTIKTTLVDNKAVAGGPLFNTAGELVGLNVVATDGKVSAIPVPKIQALLGL